MLGAANPASAFDSADLAVKRRVIDDSTRSGDPATVEESVSAEGVLSDDETKTIVFDGDGDWTFTTGDEEEILAAHGRR